MKEICANCGTDLTNAKETGDSGIYSAGEEFGLCVPCFHEEDALIETSGTNVHPDRIKLYRFIVKQR